MKKRLFFGVDISSEARDRAAVYVDELAQQFPSASAKWERSDKLHITLKFLGIVEEEKVAPLLIVIESVAAVIDPFILNVVRTGAFPAVKKPRVLWLGINDPKEKLVDMAVTIDNACSELGFGSETRKFRPHLTIARVREPKRAKDLAIAHGANEFGPIQCLCSELLIFESHLGRRGSVYTKLAAARLGAD